MWFSYKTETLDQLRSLVGEYGDREHHPLQLIFRVNEMIYRYGQHYQGSYVYFCSHDSFYLKTQAGLVARQSRVRFGNNTLSLCAVRGMSQVFRNEQGIFIHVPCYSGHHLLAQLVVRAARNTHIDEHDVQCLYEIVQYVRVRLIQLGAMHNM